MYMCQNIGFPENKMDIKGLIKAEAAAPDGGTATRIAVSRHTAGVSFHVQDAVAQEKLLAQKVA